MMAFQREPAERRCEKCHEVLTERRLTSGQHEEYCQHCGHILGHCLQPSSWVCEQCGNIQLNTLTGYQVLYCDEGCIARMTCLQAQPSRVYGAGTGDTDLEYGLAFLMEAQGVALDLGSDILRDSQQ